MSEFVRWLSAPVAKRGIFLADDSGRWRRIEYSELALGAGRAGARLVDAGVSPGDVVCMSMTTEYSSLSTFFGAWAAGATVCPLPSLSFQSQQEYVEHIAAILQQAKPVVTVTCAEFEPLIGKAMKKVGLPGSPLCMFDIDGSTYIDPRQGGDIALLQFTSGSTGTPQGVRVSWRNLEANLAVIRRWARWRIDDAVASWLPLYHDMGLIGCLLTSVAGQCDLWLMRPDQFIRDPARWLDCFGPGRASQSAAPSFAFSYLARRVAPEQLAGLDLSGWRSVMVGAEAIDPAALESFARLAAPTGFSRTTFVPAYGLAENTLAVTSPGLGGNAYMVLPDWSSFQFGKPVRIARRTRFGDENPTPGSGWLFGHGHPGIDDGIGVHIVGEDGNQLADGYLGEIMVTGTSVACGYQSEYSGRSTRFYGGTLRTGDAGFIYHGDLYVLGRMGDSLKLRGRNVYVEDLDAKVAADAGLSRDRVVIVSSCTERRAGVVVFAETKPGPWTAKVIQRLRGELGPEPTIAIVVGQRGLIQRTSSGKPRRRHMWQLLHCGHLQTATVIDGVIELATHPEEH
jgi:acyl-CoA synthetase (AMP-forming)/AMP-acid ligase II